MKARRIPSDNISTPPTPEENRPRVVTVPGLIERGDRVVREDDDSDEDYARRCEMFALGIA